MRMYSDKPEVKTKHSNVIVWKQKWQAKKKKQILTNGTTLIVAFTNIMTQKRFYKFISSF